MPFFFRVPSSVPLLRREIFLVNLTEKQMARGKSSAIANLDTPGAKRRYGELSVYEQQAEHHPNVQSIRHLLA